MLMCAYSTQLWHFFVVMVRLPRGTDVIILVDRRSQAVVQGIANALTFPLIVCIIHRLGYSCS